MTRARENADIHDGSTAITTVGTVTSGNLGSGITGFTGVKNMSTWRMDTGLEPTPGSAHVFTTWTKATNQSNGSLGSDMTHSSGVFTFPATGIWHIKFQLLFTSSTTTSIRYIEAGIETTTNNSTWVETGRAIQSLTSYNSSPDYGSESIDIIWDVTSTTNYKVRFKTYTYSGETVNVYGSSTNNFTYATFVRLGDT